MQDSIPRKNGEAFGNGRAGALSPLVAVDADKCNNCHICIKVCHVKFCNNGAGDTVTLNPGRCLGCGACITACPSDARHAIDDLPKFLELAAARRIDPAILVTHIGGLDSAVEATLNMPKIGGGKKLIYTHISMPLTAISDFARLGESDPFFAKLAELVAVSGGLWNTEAEKFILKHGESI